MRAPYAGIVATIVAVIAESFCPTPAAARTYIVEHGRPRAEIVIAESPSRSTRLAAQELQTQIEKISGARLPIVTQPGSNLPVRVYVGRSAGTDRLNITADGLRDGAYRIVSGRNWLVLIGDDTEFSPIEPWAKSNAEIVEGRAQREWDRITGAVWGLPNLLIYKDRFRMPGDTGLPDAERQPGRKLPPLEMWGHDERGSFNAVCGFLTQLGARWYMPGELGEVLPRMKSIPLPKVDETVRPDFPVRRVNIVFGVHGDDAARWAMRLGLRNPYGLGVAHGLDDMTHRSEVFAAHPDWFALYGGRRDNRPGQIVNQLCYSNEELLQATVRYVRAQFDHFKFDVVSVMPPDGYSAICQCDLCKGKETRGIADSGRLSDYVWGFVNRVAREVAKTHPDKKVLNCAYGIYTLPPPSIPRLESNVLVCIVGGRRPTDNKPEQQAKCRALREAWAAKTDNPILVFENYPLTDRGWYLPSYTPHALGESVNETKGHSMGEDIWLCTGQGFDKNSVGFNHFPVYFTARMWWGGPKADVDAMFREYCNLFYGPAAREIRAFFTYCEANWQEMEKDMSKVDAALELFAAAQAKADPGSVYGKRLALIDNYLSGLRHKRVQLAQKRGLVPTLRLVGEARSKIVVDGKLDDEAWSGCPGCAVETFRELETGRQPVFGTTVKAAWAGNNLFLAIRCAEHPGEKLNIGTTQKGDQAIWYGDAVEILLETESHSYYQLVVNPAGALVDLDRGASREAWFTWDSKAEVATQVADDHWTVEIRIPVTEDQNDPLNQVIGRKPIQSLPWHINICRQRIRDNGTEYSALSPTGTRDFHRTMKFATFYDGLSHDFEVDPTVTDYLIASAPASKLLTAHQYAEALAAFTALAEGEVTDLQKSEALDRAAAAARGMRDFARADDIAARIPIPAVRKTVLMRNLLDQRKPADVITKFGQEDIAAWPFWQSGEGWLMRGQAYAAIRAGKEAEADFVRALEFTSDWRTRRLLLMATGDNRLSALKDEPGALAAYRAIVDPARRIDDAVGFDAIRGAARLLTRAGRYDEALAVLQKAGIEKLNGHWHGVMLTSLGETLQAAGRPDEAATAWKALLADPAVTPDCRKNAEEQLKKLPR